MRRRSFLAGAVILAGAGAAWALDPRTGGTTLLETADARLTALGEAGAALTGDLSGSAVNPAVLATMDGAQVLTQFQSAPGDVKTGLLSFGRGGPWAGWGVSVAYLDAGKIDIVPAGGGASTSKSAQQDFAGSLGGAVALADWFRLGAAVKGLSSTLVEDYSATVVAGDAGFLMDLPFKGFRLGAAAQNVGSDIVYKSEGDPLPTLYRGGLSYSFSPGADELEPSQDALGWYGRRNRRQSYLWVGADAVMDKWGATYAALGLEWDFAHLAVLRLGGKLGGDDSEGFTGGIGFFIKNWRLDYSIQLVNDIEDRNRLTISYFWKADR